MESNLSGPLAQSQSFIAQAASESKDRRKRKLGHKSVLKGKKGRSYSNVVLSQGNITQVKTQSIAVAMGNSDDVIGTYVGTQSITTALGTRSETTANPLGDSTATAISMSMTRLI